MQRLIMKTAKKKKIPTKFKKYKNKLGSVASTQVILLTSVVTTGKSNKLRNNEVTAVTLVYE